MHSWRINSALVVRSLSWLIAVTFFVACSAKSRPAPSPSGTPASVSGTTSPTTEPSAQAPIEPRQGTIDSGGGKVLVCKKDGKTTVELLDLWEAVHNQNPPLPPVPSERSVADQVERALETLSVMIPNVDDHTVGSGRDQLTGNAATIAILKSYAAPFLGATSPTVRRKHGEVLVATPDSLEESLPAGCELRQAIRYEDSGKQASVDQDLLDQMEPIHLAALYVHEAVYKMLRANFDEQNSRRTRRIVGLTFGNYVFEALAPLPTPRLDCGDAAATSTGELSELISLLSIYRSADPRPYSTSWRVRAQLLGGVVALGQMDAPPPFSENRATTLEGLLNFQGDSFGDDVWGDLLLVSRVDYDIEARLRIKATGKNQKAKFYLTVRKAATPPRSLKARELECRLVER